MNVLAGRFAIFRCLLAKTNLRINKNPHQQIEWG